VRSVWALEPTLVSVLRWTPPLGAAMHGALVFRQENAKRTPRKAAYAKPKVRRPYIYFASTIVTAFCFSAAAAAAAAVVACSTRRRSCATAA
jgi:hypothetical protein